MINIATLRAMAKAGASVEVILAAVEAELVAEGVRVQASKDANAERQRRYRDKHNVSSRHVTSRDVTAEVSLSSSFLTSLESSTSKKEESKKERARKIRLPDDWQPNEKHYAKGDRAYVDQKAEDMRNWAKSKAIMRADWDATFHGFLRPREGQYVQAVKPDASIANAGRRLLAKIEDFGRPHETGGDESNTVVRLLPPGRGE